MVVEALLPWEKFGRFYKRTQAQSAVASKQGVVAIFVNAYSHAGFSSSTLVDALAMAWSVSRRFDVQKNRLNNISNWIFKIDNIFNDLI